MKRFFLNKNRLLIGSCVVLALLIASGKGFSSETFRLDNEILDKAEEKYGFSARKRLLDWVDLIRHDESYTDMEKLEKVNQFFNQLEFISDSRHWGKDDYWATPVEFIASNGGDCEDFSVAKYFTLKTLGVPEHKLSLTYVKALSLDQAHMVMTYSASPGGEPLVLDNLIDDIKPASQRPDLLPVYSFNGTGLWIAKRRGRGTFVGKSEKLELWKELLERMPEGLI